MPGPYGPGGGPNYTAKGIMALLGLVAAATTGYYYAVNSGSSGGLLFKEGTAAGTPASGERVIYAKSDGIYQKDSAGTETALAGSTISGLTTNRITMATSATTIGDSNLHDYGGAEWGFKNGGVTLTLNTASVAASRTLSVPALSGADTIATLGIANTFTKAQSITGTTDAVQLTVKANGTQTADLFRIIQSDNTLRFGINSNYTFYGLQSDGSTYGFLFTAADSRRVRIGSGDQYVWTDGDAASTIDSGIKRSAGKVIGATDGSSGEGWFQSPAGRKRQTSDATSTSTTPANLTDLTYTVAAGRKYTGRFVFKCADSTAAEGIRFDFDGGNATMTSFSAGARVITGGTSVSSVEVSSAIATDLVWTTITNETWIEVNVSFVVNAAGTFIPRFGQSTHAAGTATLYTNSFGWLEDTP